MLGKCVPSQNRHWDNNCLIISQREICVSDQTMLVIFWEILWYREILGHVKTTAFYYWEKYRLRNSCYWDTGTNGDFEIFCYWDTATNVNWRDFLLQPWDKCVLQNFRQLGPMLDLMKNIYIYLTSWWNINHFNWKKKLPFILSVLLNTVMISPIDISPIIQGIMLISSASPSSWLIVVQGHSHFTLLHRDGNLHGCQCDSLFVETTAQHPANGKCWLKMQVLTTRCASKMLATFI